MAMYDDIMDKIMLTAREHGIPYYGMLELTERCNLKCKFCYVCDRDHSTEKNQEKTTYEWLCLIKEAVNAGMLGCAFTGGDPFMREDFEEIYCKSYDMGLRVSIFTNGILIGDKQIAYLSKRIPDTVSISVYGASKETYDQVCGNGANYEKLIASLNRLHDARIPIDLKVLAIRPLIDDFEAIGCMGQTYQCPISFNDYLGPGRDDPTRMLEEWRIPSGLLKEASHSFYKGLSEYNEKSSVTPEQSMSKNRNLCAIPCNAGKCYFCITHDGRMLGCTILNCFVSYPFQDGFNNAWMSLKEQMKTAKACIECSTCQEFDYCSKCAAQRFQETGSIEYCNAYIKELAHAKR